MSEQDIGTPIQASSIRVQIPLVADLTEDQVVMWALAHGLPIKNGRIMARDVVEHIQGGILAAAARAFDGAAAITLKGR